MEHEDNIEDLPVVSELDSLKARADLLGVTYHPSIGVDKLRAKVEAAMNDKPDPDTVELTKTEAPVTSEAQLRRKAKDAALKLVRVNVVCMNPAKREWEGEIFTVGNSLIGTVKKFVPFGTSEGWHVPEIILQVMRERECQVFVNAKSANGVTIRTGKQIKEFAIDVLPPLTEKELAELARRQAMQAGQTV